MAEKIREAEVVMDVKEQGISRERKETRIKFIPQSPFFFRM